MPGKGGSSLRTGWRGAEGGGCCSSTSFGTSTDLDSSFLTTVGFVALRPKDCRVLPRPEAGKGVSTAATAAVSVDFSAPVVTSLLIASVGVAAPGAARSFVTAEEPILET